jgi:hypothetical protein
MEESMEDNEQAQTIPITLDDQVVQGDYVNFANIIHSSSEFFIDLGRVVPGKAGVKVYSRVIMTPVHVKQLLQALQHNVALFEEKFGEVRLDGNETFSVEEPSN